MGVFDDIKNIGEDIGSGVKDSSNFIKKDVIDNIDKNLGNIKPNDIIKGTKYTIEEVKKNSISAAKIIKKNGPEIGKFSIDLIQNPEKLLKYSKDIYGYGKYSYYNLKKYDKIIESNVNNFVLKPIEKASVITGNAIKDGAIVVGKGVEVAAKQVAKTTMNIIDDLTSFFDSFGQIFKEIIEKLKEITKVFDEILGVVKQLQNVVKFSKMFQFLINIFKKKVMKLIMLLINISFFMIKLYFFIITKTGLIHVISLVVVLLIFNSFYNVLNFIDILAITPLRLMFGYTFLKVNYNYFYIIFWTSAILIYMNSKKVTNFLISKIKVILSKIKIDNIILEVVEKYSAELLKLFTQLFNEIEKIF